MSNKLGILGFGNMGKAIAQGLIGRGVIKGPEVAVYDIEPQALEAAEKLGAVTVSSERELCGRSVFVLLAVKPNMAKKVLAAAGNAVAGKALLSVVAGVDQETLGQWAGGEIRILRVMPNTPALVGEGAFGLASDTTLTARERQTAEQWFSSIGLVEWVGEELMDAVTGLSGGAPAYVALFVEALADGGVQQGLKRETAYRLAAQTVYGTAKMILDTGTHPGVLINGKELRKGAVAL
ncbi:pyrroline-5-carboxylate reductase [Lachnospiraceae bacterium 54-53]